MKLEFKDIVGYLPYKVQIQRVYVGSITDTQYSDIETLNIGHAPYYFSDKCSEFNSIKLILHPLSDLTKEIEVNGEKFIPKHRLNEKYYHMYGMYNNADSDFNELIKTLDNAKGYDLIPHWMYQDLIKWHFDLFELIKHELAIDINTLK